MTQERNLYPVTIRKADSGVELTTFYLLSKEDRGAFILNLPSVFRVTEQNAPIVGQSAEEAMADLFSLWGT